VDIRPHRHDRHPGRPRADTRLRPGVRYLPTDPAHLRGHLLAADPHGPRAFHRRERQHHHAGGRGLRSHALARRLSAEADLQSHRARPLLRHPVDPGRLGARRPRARRQRRQRPRLPGDDAVLPQFRCQSGDPRQPSRQQRHGVGGRPEGPLRSRAVDPLHADHRRACGRRSLPWMDDGVAAHGRPGRQGHRLRAGRSRGGVAAALARGRRHDQVRPEADDPGHRAPTLDQRPPHAVVPGQQRSLRSHPADAAHRQPQHLPHHVRRMGSGRGAPAGSLLSAVHPQRRSLLPRGDAALGCGAGVHLHAGRVWPWRGWICWRPGSDPRQRLGAAQPRQRSVPLARRFPREDVLQRARRGRPRALGGAARPSRAPRSRPTRSGPMGTTRSR